MNSCTSGLRRRRPFVSLQVSLVVIIFFTFSNLALAGRTTSTATRPSPTRSCNTPTGPKPAMGWNSYEPFECGKRVKEYDIRYQADLIVQKGLDKSGYNTITVECGWEDYGNDDGTPVVKKRAFKDGLVPFSDYLKTKGLHLGLSTWGGQQMCKRKERRRSLMATTTNQQLLNRRDGDNNNKQYWKNYISNLTKFGLTYLMFRPCDWADPDRLQYLDNAKELNTRYLQMAQGIRDAGENIFYATGEWGVSPEAQNKYKLTNSLGISDDAQGYWNSLILNGLVPFAGKACRGSYNDLGFLQVGKNYLKGPEKITQFIFWAAAKSPLIFSKDLRYLDQSDLDMLKNPGALAQDDLGASITFKRRYSGDKDIWSGPLSDGSTVAVIINWSYDFASKLIDLADLGFTSARLYDIWNGVDLGVLYHEYGKSRKFIPKILKLTETKACTKRIFKRYPAEVADLMGTAQLRQVNPKFKAVSLIKPNGYAGVRWNNIPGGQTKDNVLFSIDYINAELSSGNVKGAKLNYKTALIIVNDDHKVYVDFPTSGQTWEDIYEGFLVSSPLEAGDSNKITIQGVDDQWAPDFVSLGVQIQPDQMAGYS